MADNYTTNSGSGGPTFASDEQDLGGSNYVQHPYVKVEWGADGAFTPVSTTNALPVGARLESSKMVAANAEVTPAFAVISATADNADTTLVAAQGTGKKIRVLSYTIICDAASTSATFYDGDPDSAGSAISGAMPLTTNAGVHAAFCPVGHFETSNNVGLFLELTGTGNVYGHLTYIVIG